MFIFEMMRKTPWKSCIGIFFIVVTGGFAIVSSVYLLPQFVKYNIEQNVLLKNNTETYNVWLAPPIPIYSYFYFFNVTNSDEIIENWSIKPHVDQLGPYVYRVIQEKTDVAFTEFGDKLVYNNHKWYFFERNMSCGPETDAFTTINLPLLVIASEVRFKSFFMQKFIKRAIGMLQQKLFERRTVRELLWGYNLTLPHMPDFIRVMFDDMIGRFNGNSTEFGLFVGPYANGTSDGNYQIDTGMADVNKVGHYDFWNAKRNLSFWSDDYCNMINGTDGTRWTPFLTGDERFYVFSSDLCRSVHLTCNDCQTHLNMPSVKIPVYRFSLGESVFADPKRNPDNQGFCTTPTCLESGVLNVSSCRRGAPVIVSEPHFYHASKTYLNAIDGLSPGPEHETYIDLEPNTGLAMSVSWNVQINVHLRHLITLWEMDSAPENFSLILPVFWMSSKAMVAEEEAVKFHDEALVNLRMAQIIVYVLYAVGAFSLFIACVWTLLVICRVIRQSRSKVTARSDTAVTILNDDDTDTDSTQSQLIDAYLV